jgi:hypothetical protein
MLPGGGACRSRFLVGRIRRWWLQGGDASSDSSLRLTGATAMTGLGWRSALGAGHG